jgi:hypothetical protein
VSQTQYQQQPMTKQIHKLQPHLLQQQHRNLIQQQQQIFSSKVQQQPTPAQQPHQQKIIIQQQQSRTLNPVQQVTQQRLPLQQRFPISVANNQQQQVQLTPQQQHQLLQLQQLQQNQTHLQINPVAIGGNNLLQKHHKKLDIGSVKGRGTRISTNRPPPGAVNLERSYQICQAVIQNSPNRHQLRAQLKPPAHFLAAAVNSNSNGPTTTITTIKREDKTQYGVVTSSNKVCFALLAIYWAQNKIQFQVQSEPNLWFRAQILTFLGRFRLET